MAKPRKRQVQQSIRFPDRNGQWRGGKRRGAGRPSQGSRSSEKHQRRKAFRAGVPIHVVLRVTPKIGRLRKRKTYAALREALITVLPRENFQVVHISIQQTHVHLLVEASDRMALARGMQGFQISAAKRLNAAVTEVGIKRRQGCVFTDRYHAELITSPRQARHALAYVLNNWRRHKEHRATIARDWRIDPFSSGDSFTGWSDLEDASALWPSTYRPLPVRPPRSWSLRAGWKRHGLIATTEVPGPKASVASPVLAD
jgi:putative transposase